MKEATISRKEQKERILRDHTERITLSFYRYVRIRDPRVMQDVLRKELRDLGCLGRIYIASEGVNAQMNVPKDNWDAFNSFIQSIPEFNGVPFKIAVEEANVPSFYKLTIKVKDKIVADGLNDDSFDVTKTGDYVTAQEMNAYIDDPDAVIVDMRNGYESEIGHFERAITPDVDTFREELQVLPQMLKVHKNKKLVLYCTGGIRCEKASAWLRYNGFNDVKHLRGGIIDYKRQVEEEKLPNRFKGKNFVFDGRMSERISDEVIAHCHLCHTEKCDEHIHCKNQACHVLFICCDTCKAQKKGYCSYTCMIFDRFPLKVKNSLTKNNHRKKLEQFKKHRLKGK